MLTAICMLFTLLPFNVLTVTAADGKFGGDGTPQNPYLIEDAADLNAFRDKVNGGNTNINGRLVNDIDLNENFDQDLFAVDGNGNATYNGSPDIPAFEQWTPIGYNGISGILAFNGTLDGDGHTISGLYINTADDTSNKYYALIGYLGNGGTVKNLGIENSVVKMNTINIYAAGIVGNNEGTIENCYNDADIYGNSDVGGIALGNFNIIRNCYNTGTVTSTLMSAGGIAGNLSYGSNITNCYNTGSVSATGDYAYSGGVVGDNYGTVTNCYNTGSVSVTKDHANAGGVAGNNIGTVTNSYNTGSVSATENNAFVGGVVGRNNSTAENCYYLDTTAEQGVGYGSSDGAQEVSIEDVEDAENGLLAKLAEGSGEGVWNIQLSAMGSWEYGKPAVQPVLSWQTVIQNAPAYIVTIPEKATAGGEAVSVSLSEVGALRTFCRRN